MEKRCSGFGSDGPHWLPATLEHFHSNGPGRLRHMCKEHSNVKRVGSDHHAEQRAKQRAANLVWSMGLEPVCADCGISNQAALDRDGRRLDFDHIDPRTKLFDIGAKLNCSREFLQPELDKCQLLCQPCHWVKTANDKLRSS